MTRIKFKFNCPCMESWEIEIPKPKMTGWILAKTTCPNCESYYDLKVRQNKKEKGRIEMQVMKSLASEKLTRTLQLRSMMKLKSPLRWKEELPK